MNTHLTLSCPVYQSFRTAQIAGMFDVPIDEKQQTLIDVATPPALSDEWQLALIAGPSGSGKSSIVKHLYKDYLITGFDWSSEKALIDNFPLSVKETTQLLTAVGFSSPPSWLKPYSVLSNGEKFRCDLAMSLMLATSENRPLVVFDEFTSVVDRTVAKAASAALAKMLKRDRRCKFIAVSCHYDIAEYLEPDWLLDTASGQLERRRLRRRNIDLQVFRCKHTAWKLFAKHHYLSGSLAKHCTCYLALWNEEPAAFCAVIPQYGFKNRKRVSRIVVLPDYQGLGIGAAFMEGIAAMYVAQGQRFSITASHPAIIAHCKRSPLWTAVNFMPTGSKFSQGRAVVSFEYREK